MQIRELFVKKVDRPINGVIKADQCDRDSIWQELDEYVVTKQITEYLRRFFDAYLAGFDRPNDPVIASRMGVWVSGFFGSGKSHFIKILSYLLENIQAIDPELKTKKPALSFFDDSKVTDPMLRADIQRVAQYTADVILFNIDAKADSSTNRDVILQVFLRVFNEKLGFSGDAPHIANMERHLVKEGAYDVFKKVFKDNNGDSWESQRDAVGFLRDDVVYALSQALGMSEESAGQWFDKADETFKINIESFAELVRDYLKTKPASHRIVFLVDEVGQFIGDNTHLMLNLQTITEQLGTVCNGRAWIVVTSQEDIDAAIGETNKAKSQDFSKIQGRFHTRLSLASSNTDEVISKRLLSKTDAAHDELRDVFIAQGDIINNQLAFSSEGVTLAGYKDAAEYVSYYPFAPYQFTLLSKIFEAIRRHGATGRHLSKGERSLLDAFQTAVKGILNHDINRLVPLFDFYSSIESFLDSTVRHAIDNAEKQVGRLFESFDIKLLKVLFLIKYIPEIVKGKVDNLATLCVEEIDIDKLVLKQRIQESLVRLEKQNLVSRNGDEWMFLTNEEQDIAREISHEVISSSELSRTLAELVFEEVWKSQTKVRHKNSKADYEFNRLLDGKPWKSTHHELSLELITELHDEYPLYTEAKCRLYSSGNPSRIILRLNQGERLYEELQTYLKIEQFIQSKFDNASPTGRKILTFKKDENRERKERLRFQLERLIVTTDIYALGEQVQIKAAGSQAILEEAINYLVSNSYTKLAYLKPTANAFTEISAVLSADSVQQLNLGNGDIPNHLALKEVSEYLKIKASHSAVVLEDVVKYFSGNTYGWKPEWEIVLLVARLFMAGEITLMMDSTPLSPAAALEPLSKSQKFKFVSILKRKKTGTLELNQARNLYKDLFTNLAPEEEDALVAAYRSKLNDWDKLLTVYAPLANQPHYPGKAAIDGLQSRIKKQLAIQDSAAFIEALLKQKEDWRDAEEEYHDLTGFYDKDKGQILTWRRLLSGLMAVKDNREKLLEDAKVANALHQLEKIRDNLSPYGTINQIESLLATVESANHALVDEKRKHALERVDAHIATVQTDLEQINAEPMLRNKALLGLQQLRIKVETSNSIPTIFYLQNQALELMDTAQDIIQKAHEEQLKAIAKSSVALPKTDNLGATTPNVSTPKPQAPVLKPTKTIKASNLTIGKSYLESTNDVESYLQKLRSELLQAIEDGQRVRIE
ncbi:MAG: BREX system P-loop protein BrxC [Agitococcus sp.]